MNSRRRRPSLGRLRIAALLAALAGAVVPFAACGGGKIGPGGSGGGGTGGGAAGGSTNAGGHTTHHHRDSGPDVGPDTGIEDASDGGRDFSTDRNKFFGTSRCSEAHLLLCEDFESGSLDTSTWNVVGDTPVVGTAEHARGSHALHITKSGNGPSYIKETKTFPVANDTYFGRMFVKFVKLPTTASMSYAHWTFAAASGTGATGEIRLSGQLQNGRNLFGVGTDTGQDPNGSGDWTNSDNDPSGNPMAVPTGSWICIEWMHKGDTSETQFWWDATLHPSLDTSLTMHGGNSNPYTLPMFTNVWVGWQEYQPSTEDFEMWVDEIGIDTARIGCVL
jgi:hypothetical protein